MASLASLRVAPPLAPGNSPHFDALYVHEAARASLPEPPQPEAFVPSVGDILKHTRATW